MNIAGTVFWILVVVFGPVLSYNIDGPHLHGPKLSFEFTQPIYNASVPENSMGSTLVVSAKKMGVWNQGQDKKVKIEIIDGDPLKQFKTEERQVGIFCFLLLRVNNNERSLNREFKDLYKLRVKATLYELVTNNQSFSIERHKDYHASSNELVNNGDERFVHKFAERKNQRNRDQSNRRSDESVQNEQSNRSRRRTRTVFGTHNSFNYESTTDLSNIMDDIKPGNSDGFNSHPSSNIFSPNIVRSKTRNKGNRSRGRTSRDEKNRPRNKLNKKSERRKNKKQLNNPTESKNAFDNQTSLISTTRRPEILEDIKLIPVATAECIIYVQILDQPDNAPLFEQRSYDITVMDDTPILSRIFKIIAVDADVGKNQEIYYSLTEMSPYFSVDPILGILSPTRSLVGMVGKRQQLRIQARNRWNTGPTAESTANVSIRPSNRHTPQILINKPPQVESRPYGVIYAIVSCRDNDEGLNGLVDLTIKEGDPNGIFRVTPTKSRNEFYIVMAPVVAKNYNFKGQQKPTTFNLTLRAQDFGQPSKSSEKEIQLKVSDSQWMSKSPSSTLFDKDLYEVEISESSPPHSTVFRFPRPDPKVILGISSGNEGEEFILEKSGVLYTRKWLDFDRRSIFTLTVDSLDLRPARLDHARRQRSAVKLVIKLIDENKFWPVFETTGDGNITEVSFIENEPIGSLVTKLTARDPDQGENGYVTYNMANLNHIPFSIDHFTGEIRSTEVLDYETSRRIYYAHIRATDWGMPFRRESEMKVKVSLKNSNDNRPLFVYTNCVSVIDRSIKFETEFGRLIALDFDNDPVTYKIVYGNSDSCFSIDNSGSLRVMCDLKDFRTSKRILNLTASDGEYYSDIMTVKIELRNTLRTNFSKSESPRAGIKLYSTSHSVFECQDTGVQERYDRLLATSEENNKEENGMDDEETFLLPKHYTENNQPQFLDFPTEIKVNESVEIGTRVLQLRAKDTDKTYNGFLNFVISEGDESHGAWDIETTPWKGDSVQVAYLVVARPLDREEFTSYDLNISVYDQGKPPKHMSKMLSIKVLDANDNAPIFEKSAMKLKVREGKELIGETITQVKAFDDDEVGSPNSRITYKFQNDSIQKFHIDERSGKVKLLSELDREKEDIYELFIVAEDSGFPNKLSSTAVLTIIVEDKNDSPPKFVSFGTNVKGRVIKIREDWPLYSVVTRVFANDADLGLGGVVSYTLVDGSRGDFIIDETSGVIRVNRKLDYQRTSMYNLTIIAKDFGTPSLSSETYLVIEIYDVFEDTQLHLSFPEMVVEARIKEGSPVGSFIVQISPTTSSQISHSGVYFSLEGDSQFLFSIDNMGVVRNSYELDYETQSHWHYLTVIAQSSFDLQNIAYSFLVIELENENDCVPLTVKPMYTAEVDENLDSGTFVLKVQAFDCDNSVDELRYSIKSFNPYFDIDPISGIITTLVSLDREESSEHTFDVVVADTSSPYLNSTTKVVIRVKDINDHVPKTLLYSGSIYNIPEFGNEVLEDEPTEDDENMIQLENEDQEYLKWSDWQMMDGGEEMPMAEGWKKLYRVVAFDPDSGLNGSIQYRLKYRVTTGENLGESDVYTIHPQTGEIFTSASSIKSDTILKFVIEVSDNNGSAEGLKSETHLLLRVKSVDSHRVSQPPIIFLLPNHEISLTTKEVPGYTVETLEANDPEDDPLWYDIVSGDPEQFFIMYPDSQNLILARSIPTPRVFKLNVSVSDGFNFVFVQLVVKVIESSEHVSSLIWEQENYTSYISESVPAFTLVTTVRVNESSLGTYASNSVLYGFHNAQDMRSLKIFTIDTVSGAVRIASTDLIDRETLPQHIITVKARDSKTYSFVRLIITLLDENDKVPIFSTNSQLEVRIPETLAVGTLVTQVFAYDADSGRNGFLTYSIIYGNIGSTFEIESQSGRIFLKKPLSIPYDDSSIEYQLTVKASDGGAPPKSSTTSLSIFVTPPSDNRVLALACSGSPDNPPNLPRDKHCTCTVHVQENSSPGTFVARIHVMNSITGVSFDIEENRKNRFWIDTGTGVILVGKHNVLDREVESSYEIHVKAVNSQGASSSCKVTVDLGDENDNAPQFLNQLFYEGEISEDAPIGTLVMEKVGKLQSQVYSSEKHPLVFRSIDYDFGKNAIVTYSFVEEEEMRTVFYIDPSSGALLLVTSLDYEKRQFYSFHVRVCDYQFCDTNLANVTVWVENVNDQEPQIMSSRVDFLLPTAKGVMVHQMVASDPDGDNLKFSIVRNNTSGNFGIDANTGIIYVENSETITNGEQVLEVSVTDNRFTKTATLTIDVKNLEKHKSFGFRNSTFETSFSENSTKIVNLISLALQGTHLNEDLQFRILNPTIYFGIMRTSGIVFTKGKKLDREQNPKHSLLIEVRGDESTRISRCFLNITVTDVNDNAPYWTGNLPYVTTALLSSKPGDLIFQVKAMDKDLAENGLVRYELVRSPFGDIYDVNKQTGEIHLRRKPDSLGHHELIIKAYDAGIPSLHTTTSVQVEIVTHDQPVFQHAFYETWLPESAPIHSTALAVIAVAKNPVLYSIEGGNELDAFGIDYQTGTIYVNTPLDYETTPVHHLKIRATDLKTTSWSSTMVQISLKDTNDSPPVSEKDSYMFQVLEGQIPPGGIVGLIKASDKDEGINAILNYEILSDQKIKRKTRSLTTEEYLRQNIMMNEDPTSNNRSSEILNLFAIKQDGLVILKQPLDYENAHEYPFSVLIRDSGVPSLSTTVLVTINVININDNPPIFSQSTYNVKVSELCPKGQIVLKVEAVDLDEIDALRYSMVGEYSERPIFEIEKSTGVVTLMEPQGLQNFLNFTFNISVTDGVFTSYSKLFIEVQPQNHYVPAFDLSIYEVLAPESSPDDFLVTTLRASDSDRGIYGQLTYAFADTDEPSLFKIHETNGQVRLSSTPDVSLDREYKESHTLQVVARDGGKWIGYTKLVVKVEKKKTNPVFPVSEYRVTVPVDKMRSKIPILQAVALDDDNEFGLKYSIVDVNVGNLSLKRDSQYFEINSENGDLRFKVSEEDLEKMDLEAKLNFQIWIRADDGELHGTIPVTVIVLPNSEPTPELHPANATFFVKDDAAVGHVITSFRVSNIESPNFRIVSNNEDLFQVDRHGNLFVNSLLDQDEDKHTVVVWAQSPDSLIVTTSQVTIRVLSTFSNKPKFNQVEYRLTLAEDFPEGSYVFIAQAIDSDKGGNIKERYELISEDPTDLHHFAINQENGWITLINRLDYERNHNHILRIVAYDSENPQLKSTTTLIIDVMNVDDEPSIFDSTNYYAEVQEDVSPGTVIKTLRIVDLDDVNGNRNSTISPQYLAFYIISGNKGSRFKIDEQGRIMNWRKLDAEVQQEYNLRVLVTDGFNEDYTNVTIKVIDVNDNLPVCPLPHYYQELSEGSIIGAYVATIEAFDLDVDAKSPVFSLSGNGMEDFRIDPDSGVIFVNASLDRENKHSTYSLTIHARDRNNAQFECSSQIRIRILDENNNSPQFSEEKFIFSIREDSETGSLVGKINAQDRDSGINAKIRYSLIGTRTKFNEPVKDQFGLDSVSGVISLLRPVDRELISEYNLTVSATDGGTPSLSSVTHVTIKVFDINDNPPIFEQTSYSATISEVSEISYSRRKRNACKVLFSSQSAAVATEILKVHATSKDEGINAEITYDIVGGNGYHHFIINNETGAIFTNSSLDYERVREYLITVRARDGPPDNQLASQATVNITVADENDNPPILQQSYSVSIAENLPVSTLVVQITAADIDSGDNAQIRYSFGNGDPMNSFKINQNTGAIYVASVLDREMIPFYTLEVIATDLGSPPLSSTTLVEIQITDVNENYTAIVQEDRIVGFKVLTFEVSDADAPPNAGPFSWDLRSRDEEQPGTSLPFTISDTGSLLISGKLNFLRKSIYNLQVIVYDNGTPPLESTANVTIQVVDKSQWPPVVSALSVTAVTLGDTYPAGILGVCHASDFDAFDVLTYSLLKTKSSSFFTIDHLNGTLYNLIPLREGTYELGIIVSDGRWSARGDAYVKVVSMGSLFPDISVDQAQYESNQSTEVIQSTKNRKEMNNFILMTVSGHNRQSLLNRIYALTNVIKEAVAVESTIPSSSYEVVLLSVQPSSEQNSFLEQRVELSDSNRSKREALIPSVDIILAVRKAPDSTFVPSLELIKKLRFAHPQIEAVLSGRIVQLTSDICKENSCDRGTCRTVASFDGSQSLITTETLSLITPNHNLETLCICPAGYGGVRCEKIINACAHSECTPGFICVPDNSAQGYACLCRKTNCSPESNCEDQCTQQAVSFSGTSFLAYNVGPILERELTISLRIKTLYTSGTLMYTFGEFDYGILEINQGLVQFSWNLGTGKEVLTVTSISVSDNRWHRVVLQLRDSIAILRVNERSTQRQKSQGPARTLHTGGIIYIGSKMIGSSASPIDKLLPAQSFIGCMKDIRFGYIQENGEKKVELLHTQEVKHYITPSIHFPIDPALEPRNDKTPENTSPGDQVNIRMHLLPLHSSHKDPAGSQLTWSKNISFTCPKVIHFSEACRSLPCKNGGTCQADSTPNGYRCDCHSRFHGMNCEIDLEPCGSSPCLNNGICRPTSNSISFSPSLISGSDHQEPQFYCQCAEDATYGSRCEKGRFCKNTDGVGESEVCNHRGECEDGPSGPICYCEPGYTGSTCQLDRNECEQPNACAPGSTCVNFMGGFRCLCPSNASGIRCTKLLTTPSIVANDYQIIILIFIIILAFIILLIVFIFVRRCCIARERNLGSNSIPLTSSQIKLQDNRIPIVRDNREHVLRNRDSKISNLEVRPVSAGSEIFQTDRGVLDPLKSYGSGDDLEKTQFINNLMKPGVMDKKKCGAAAWDTNRDDYPKIQNYMKTEINWGTKGSKPSSPVSTGPSAGYNWETNDLPQASNISAVRSSFHLPPPDAVSNLSHDSNNEVPINLALLPPVNDCGKVIEAQVLEEPSRPSGSHYKERSWTVSDLDDYLLPNPNIDEDPEDTGPIAIRNRYQKKPSSSNNNFNSKDPDTEAEEINENSSLLTAPPLPILVQTPCLSAHSSTMDSNKTSNNVSPKKRFATVYSKSTGNSNPNCNSGTRRKNYSKTTHITEV